MGGSISNWEHWIDEYRLFFEQRPAFFRDFMEGVLDLNGVYELTVDFDINSGGYVLINRNQMESRSIKKTFRLGDILKMTALKLLQSSKVSIKYKCDFENKVQYLRYTGT